MNHGDDPVKTSSVSNAQVKDFVSRKEAGIREFCNLGPKVLITIRHANRYYGHIVGTRLWNEKKGLFDNNHEFWEEYKKENDADLRDYFDVDESHSFTIHELLQHRMSVVSTNQGKVASFESGQDCQSRH